MRQCGLHVLLAHTNIALKSTAVPSFPANAKLWLLTISCCRAVDPAIEYRLSQLEQQAVKRHKTGFTETPTPVADGEMLQWKRLSSV